MFPVDTFACERGDIMVSQRNIGIIGFAFGFLLLLPAIILIKWCYFTLNNYRCHNSDLSSSVTRIVGKAWTLLLEDIVGNLKYCRATIKSLKTFLSIL